MVSFIADLFENIGKSLKTLALVLFYLGTLATVVLAAMLIISIFTAGFHDYTIYVLLLIVGILLSTCIVSFPLYGLGELVDRTREISERGRQNPNPPQNG